MSKVISFALWGQDPKYCVGALENAKDAAKFYPDWQTVFHVHKDVPEDTIGKLRGHKNAKVKIFSGEANWKFSLTRFLPFLDENVEYFISRDCDSRFSKREVDAVNEWLDSGKLCHTMKDHPCHYSFPLLAGMTGFRNPCLFDFAAMLESYENADYYHYDQDFLRDVVFPFYNKSIVFHHKDNFPSPREENRFVGQVFDEFNKTPQEHLDLLSFE